VPGDAVRVRASELSAGRPNDASWSGRWTVEHRSPLALQVFVLLKACIVLRSSSGALTLHGKAPESKAARLEACWELVLQTLRERPGP
jgi:hypothetical protein